MPLPHPRHSGTDGTHDEPGRAQHDGDQEECATQRSEHVITQPSSLVSKILERGVKDDEDDEGDGRRHEQSQELLRRLPRMGDSKDEEDRCEVGHHDPGGVVGDAFNSGGRYKRHASAEKDQRPESVASTECLQHDNLHSSSWLLHYAAPTTTREA